MCVLGFRVHDVLHILLSLLLFFEKCESTSLSVYATFPDFFLVHQFQIGVVQKKPTLGLVIFFPLERKAPPAVPTVLHLSQPTLDLGNLLLQFFLLPRVFLSLHRWRWLLDWLNNLDRVFFLTFLVDGFAEEKKHSENNDSNSDKKPLQKVHCLLLAHRACLLPDDFQVTLHFSNLSIYLNI